MIGIEFTTCWQTHYSLRVLLRYANRNVYPNPVETPCANATPVDSDPEAELIAQPNDIPNKPAGAKIQSQPVAEARGYFPSKTTV